jgi:hypothetical protein
MNRGTLWIVLLSVCALAVAGCGGSSHRVTITTAPTTLTAGTSSNVIAIDSHDSSDQINWTCAPTGACGSFNPTPTQSGAASSYTAPAVAPSGGSVMITATSTDHPSRSATVSIAITAVQAANFVFSLNGEENNDSGDFYSLAGVVAIAQDGSGNVLSGEQDYNDGDGNTSPQPTGDSITGGTLVMATDGSGNATLTLTTSNTDLPNGGTEVFALAFANPNHAVIVQFDGSATSSGSYDLQISTAAPVGAPSASFSFAASGTNTDGDPVCDGGMFSVDASGNITGIYDLNDSDNQPATFANPIPAGVTTGSVDTFGRGVITGALFGGAAINYYVVGPEVLRLIAVDTAATALGSAYGQGTSAGSFSSASLGPSVFQIGSVASLYGAVGEFSTGAEAGVVKGKARANTPVREGIPACSGTVECSFNGEGDFNDLNTGGGGGPDQITGSYSIATTGYGSLNIDDGDLGTVVTFGVYAVDPTLNILDPNNTTDTADSGGALIAEMDANLFGTGSIVPQTDVTQTSFSGFYAFGGQGIGDGGEFDFLGTGTVTPGDSNSTFVGEGALSDPFGVFDAPSEIPVTYSATPSLPDNDGRYFINPLVVETGPDTTFNLSDVAVYQASGGQLFWVDTEEGRYFLGPLEQGTAPTSDARKAQAKASVKKH